jgi:hypothetical protein
LIQVKEVSGLVSLVAQRRWLGSIQRREPVEPLASQDSGKGGFGNAEHHRDLRIGAALAAQGDDLGLQLGSGLPGLAVRRRRAIVKPQREILGFGPQKPGAHGLFAHPINGSRGSQRAAQLPVFPGHLGSHQRGQSSISVHVVPRGRRAVACSSTTSLPNHTPADNLLKHDS